MPIKVYDEITYPFPYFNGATIEVCEWVNNFNPHVLMELIINKSPPPTHPGLSKSITSPNF